MPCYDPQAAYERSENERLAQNARVALPILETKIKDLTSRNDLLMRAVCKVDTLYLSGDASEDFKLLWEETIDNDSEFATLLIEHRKFDMERRYKAYTSNYPQFSPEQINTMVLTGVLEDV